MIKLTKNNKHNCIVKNDRFTSVIPGNPHEKFRKWENIFCTVFHTKAK